MRAGVVYKNENKQTPRYSEPGLPELPEQDMCKSWSREAGHRLQGEVQLLDFLLLVVES